MADTIDLFAGFPTKKAPDLFAGFPTKKAPDLFAGFPVKPKAGAQAPASPPVSPVAPQAKAGGISPMMIGGATGTPSSPSGPAYMQGVGSDKNVLDRAASLYTEAGNIARKVRLADEAAKVGAATEAYNAAKDISQLNYGPAEQAIVNAVGPGGAVGQYLGAPLAAVAQGAVAAGAVGANAIFNYLPNIAGRAVAGGIGGAKTAYQGAPAEYEENVEKAQREVVDPYFAMEMGRGAETFKVPKPEEVVQDWAKGKPKAPDLFADMPGAFNPDVVPPDATIKSAAVFNPATGDVATGDSHAQVYDNNPGHTGVEGFVTSSGHFVDRTEGAEIARKAKQVPENFTGELRSEHLKGYPGEGKPGGEEPPASIKNEPIPPAPVEARAPVSAKDRPIPESPATIAAQLREFEAGRRPAVFYPSTMPKETIPTPPKGAAVYTDPNKGTFHYDPKSLSVQQLKEDIAADRFGKHLGLGPYNKADVEASVARGHQPMSLVERAPDGTELRTAATTDEFVAELKQAFGINKAPDSIIAIEPMGKVPDERAKAMAQPAASKVQIVYHPQIDENGKQVEIKNPTQPTYPAEPVTPNKRATFVPGGKVPPEFKSWEDAPKTTYGWFVVEGKNPALDTPFQPHPTLPSGAGVIIREPDGRVWTLSPTNRFGGHEDSLPKGRREKALDLQSTAIKETFEETGLKVKLVGIVGDYDLDYSRARFYLAERVGGSPADMGWETQAVHVMPAAEALKRDLIGKERKVLEDGLKAKPVEAAKPDLFANMPSKTKGKKKVVSPAVEPPSLAAAEGLSEAKYKELVDSGKLEEYMLKGNNTYGETFGMKPEDYEAAKKTAGGKNPFLGNLSGTLKARIARAKAMGFRSDLQFYHSTNSKIINFNMGKSKSGEKAFFLTKDKPEKAYGSIVMPLWIKPGKMIEVSWKDFSPSSYYNNSSMKSVIAYAKSKGADTVRIKDIQDISISGNPKYDQYLVFDPRNIRRSDDAAFNPAYASSSNTLSAAAAPKEPLPDVPASKFITGEEDNFNRLTTNAAADESELMNLTKEASKAIPREADERLYAQEEGDTSVRVSPEERAAYDRIMGPLKTEERDLFEEIKALGVTEDEVPELNPNYVHRLEKGKTPGVDKYTSPASKNGPVTGGGKLPRTTGSLKNRVLFVIENEKGVRKVVAVGDKGIALAGKNETYTPLKKVGDATKPGDTFLIEGNRWTIKQALTSELEQATGREYYKSAIANRVLNVQALRKVARSLYELQRIKDLPEFAEYARPIAAKDIPAGWRIPKMPTFKNYYMHPEWANVIDDFWGHDPALGNTLQKVNAFAIGSLFWSPIKHILNTGTDWWKARGWDWITPAGIRSLLIDTPKALKEVVTQGPLYQALQREGSSLLFNRTVNRDFHMKVLDRVGQDIKKNPAKWDPIARALGVGPSDLAAAIYKGSSHALWAASDMFMMQRVLELQRKGMGLREAIADAETHIVNYRLPTKVLNSRMLQRAMSDPTVTQFSRYHYGQWKAYAHMINALVRGSGKEKLEASGQLMALLVLGSFVFPLISLGIQKLTGIEGLELAPAGPLSIAEFGFNYGVQKGEELLSEKGWHLPSWLVNYYNGDKDFIRTIAGAITISPVLKTGLEMFPFNRNSFTGQTIVEPGDWKAGRYGRVAAQIAEHLAGGLVQPYQAISQGVMSEKDLGRSLLEQGLGLREKTDKAKAGRAKANVYKQKEAITRERKPRGLIEKYLP